MGRRGDMGRARILQGRAIRFENPATGAGFCGRVHSVAGLGDWSEYGHLQPASRVVLRLLPVPNPQQLVQLTYTFPSKGRWFSYPQLERFRTESRTLSGVFGGVRLGRLNVGFEPSARHRATRVPIASSPYSAWFRGAGGFSCPATIARVRRLPSSAMPIGAAGSVEILRLSARRSRSISSRSR